MTNPDILKVKNELADTYLADMKEKLSFLEQSAIMLVEKKIRMLLLQEDALPEDIKHITLTKFEQFLVSLSPDTANSVFNFLKEKQQLILHAKTVEELEDLKKGIVSKPDIVPEQSPNAMPEKTNVSSGVNNKVDHKKQTPVDSPSKDGGSVVETAVLGCALVAEYPYGKLRSFIAWKHVEAMTNTLWEAEMKSWFQDLESIVKNKLQNWQLLEKQKKQLESSLSALEDAEKSSKSINELKIWKSLVKDGKVTNQLFEVCKLSDEWMVAMGAISKDANLIADIAKATEESHVKALLQVKWLTWVSDETIKLLAETQEASAIEWITKVLSKGAELSKLASIAKAIPILDIAYIGTQAYQWRNEDYSSFHNEDLKSNAKARNAVKYGTNIASMAGLTLAACLSAWPVGWVGAVVTGWVMWWVELINYGADTLYFDVKDFYLQKRDDFIKQYKTEIKQSIIAAFAGASWKNVSINESVCAVLPWGIEKNKKEKTLQEALWAMIYLEEAPQIAPEVYALDKDNSAATLSWDEKKQYDTQKALLEKTIAIRMKYVEQYLAGWPKSLEFTNAIKQNNGMEFLEHVATRSRIYKRMQEDASIQSTDVDDYVRKVGEKLQQEDSKVFNVLQSYKKKDPQWYAEFLARADSFCSRCKDVIDAQYKQIVPTMDFVRRYAERDWLEIDKDKKYIWWFDHNDKATEELFVKLHEGEDISSLTATVLSEEEMKTNLAYKNDVLDRDAIEYSNNVWQNVVYRIAKEFHGYSWMNNMTALQTFFQEGKEKTMGLYYTVDGGWYMNSDYARDKKIDIQDIEKKTEKELLHDWFGEHRASFKNFVAVIDPMLAPAIVAQTINSDNLSDVIVTKTKTVDANLNNEFIKKAMNILHEEKQTVVDKEKTTKEIIDYIRKNAVNGYVALPYGLLNDAARAGLGNLRCFYFTVDQWKIIAVTDHEHVGQPCDIPWTIKKYISWVGGKGTDIDSKNVVLVEATWDNKKAIEETSVLTKEIAKTAWEISRQWRRWNIIYDPVKWTIASWWWEIGLAQKNGKREVAGWNIGIAYDSLREALAVANILNRFRMYKLEHKLSLSARTLGWLWNNIGGWLLNRRGWTFIWYEMIDRTTINTYFNHTFDTSEHSKEFIDFVEKKLT